MFHWEKIYLGMGSVVGEDNGTSPLILKYLKVTRCHRH